MSARKRRSKGHVHAFLAQGLVNDAHGKWVKATKMEAETYTARAEENAKRNRANRKAKAKRRAVLWQEAERLARQELAKDGDTSSPLHWFVVSFYGKLNHR